MRSLKIFLYIKKCRAPTTIGIFHREKDSCGFTLIEIVIAIGILAFVLGMGSYLGIDSYKRHLFQSEERIIVSVLALARTLALDNLNQLPHGVCVAEIDSAYFYLVFEGVSCNPQATINEKIAANPGIIISGGLSTSTPVVFAQLSGKTANATATISDGVRSANILINHEGTIIW